MVVRATIGYLIAQPIGDATASYASTPYFRSVMAKSGRSIRMAAALTIATHGAGMHGMIVLTGALVQLFTLFQFRRMLTERGCRPDRKALKTTSSSAAFGRIGVQLARELHRGRPRLPDPPGAGRGQDRRCAGLGPDHRGRRDGGNHAARRRDRAGTNAGHRAAQRRGQCVLITLSARNPPRQLEIIARGEAPTTESKLSRGRGQGGVAHPISAQADRG